MKRIIAPLMIMLFFGCGLAAADDLAKQSQNPVGNMVSVPVEYWHYGGMPNDSSADVVVAKPVYPVNLGKYNLINCVIVPWVSVETNFN